jgi:hypothetical protein
MAWCKTGVRVRVRVRVKGFHFNSFPPKLNSTVAKGTVSSTTEP